MTTMTTMMTTPAGGDQFNLAIQPSGIKPRNGGMEDNDDDDDDDDDADHCGWGTPGSQEGQISSTSSNGGVYVAALELQRAIAARDFIQAAHI